MTNKEVVNKLVAYFLEKSDFETTARVLANYMIDMHRLANPWDLEKEERDCLFARMYKNSETLLDFIKNGSAESPVFKNVQRAEDVD